MSPAAAITLAVACLATLGAAVAWRLSRAPIWGDLRRFAALSAATAFYGFLEVAGQFDLSPGIRVAVAALAGTASALVCWGWLWYTEGEPTRLDRWLRGATLGIGAIALVPRLSVDVATHHAHGEPPTAGWHHYTMTAAGVAISLALLAVGLFIAARLVRAWRSGDRRAGALAIACAAAILIAFSDISEHAGWSEAPHLLGLALAVPLGVAAWIVGSRFLADAGALHELRLRLEGLVEERTRELAEANAALLQAEKLAALGQFASGVAHEVNNPASVVTANLSHLSGELTRGMQAAEAKAVVDESIDAMRRINELVRKLLDAGRLADLPPGAGNVQLSAAVSRAFSELRPRLRTGVELVNRVPNDLLVRGGEEVVRQVLSNLVANAAEAIPGTREGRVQVTAQVEGPAVKVLIEDDGAGMTPEVLRRAFDPFFTTKPQGRGSGLGLPITRGLIEGIGGQIWLESEPGQGTRAALELPAGTPA